MALTPGTRLGVYEVTAQIGVGGMGEVYRATDSNLKRSVAIKVLPALVAGDADRLARFQREAEVLAALNHPNIAAIYGLEKTPDFTALVMELVEGDDLSQRIAKGAIPIDEVLPVAKQIAEALEAAHEQGIIHRDLKPANIKVRADGTVKVLDFGLAKAMEPAAGSSPSLSMSPTITPPMTQAGMILGTTAYMSPEQAKGRTVDRRTDVWAFGAVLFEMLTGRRAFVGEDSIETIAAVINKQPDWSALPAGTPTNIRTLLGRCLEKDRKRRLDSAAAARLEIEDACTAPALQPTQATAPTRAVSSMGPWIALAVSTVVIIALTIPTVRHLRETPPPETRVDIVTPATDQPASFALSPDGRQIVFVASGDGASRLWLRSLTTTATQPLAGSEGATAPFWSPDNRSIGFFADGKLKRLDLGGGTPQTLGASAGARGGTWNADGVILFALSSGPVLRVPAVGGQAVPVTALDRQSSHRLPSFLPDGRHFLFLATGATPDTTGLYLGSLDSPESRRLTPVATAGVYLSSGWLLWVRSGTLVAQRFSLEGRVLTGDPVTLADSVVVEPVFQTPAAVSVSVTGLVAYRSGTAGRRQLAWFDRSGKALGTFGAADESGLTSARLSPDGRRVAVSRTVEGNADIWLLDGTRTSRFTFDAAIDQFPVWSPDGSRIVFQSDRKGTRHIYSKSSSGTSAEDLLVESSQITVPSDWSADGRFMLYYSIDPQTARDLWVVPMVGDRAPWVFLKTRFDERWGQFSPDGHWVAYMSDESGRNEIYVRPFAKPAASGAPADAGGQWQVSTAGGTFPRWRPDGKELYYIGPGGEMLAAPMRTTDLTLTPGAPVVLFPTRIVGGGVDETQGPQYDVTRDGRFLINTVLDSAAAPITLLQNWQPGAKK